MSTGVANNIKTAFLNGLSGMLKLSFQLNLRLSKN
jgi:hypothetical protein